MSVVITIDSVDKTSQIDWKSINREEVLTKEPNSLSFLIKNYESKSYKPEVGDEVIMTIGGDREFGGFIVEVLDEVEARLGYVKVICKDYNHSLDRELVSKTYENETVDDIISDLLTTFSSGFTDNNVNCPITIDKVVFNYLPIGRCLEKITELVGDYDWYVDYDKDVHFFNPQLESSAFNLTDTSNNYVFNSLSVREDTHQLRNEIVIRGGLLTSDTNRVEYLSGDGTADIFPLATKFASLPAVSIGGSSITVGVDNIDTGGFQSYWNYNEKSLKFVTPPASGTSNITATAPYQYPLILQKRNESSIVTYGVFQHLIIDKTIKDLETAGLRADAELIKYSNPEKTANFTTYTSGLKTGQYINITSDIRNINSSFVIQVIKSKLRRPDADTMEHDIQAITQEDVGINDILARLIIKNPASQIDISEDEVVSRIRQLTDTFGIEDNTPTVTTTSPPYYVGSTAIMGFFTMGS